MKKHEAQCSCGNAVNITIPVECEFLQVECQNCHRMILDYEQNETSTVNIISQKSLKIPGDIEKYKILKTLGKGASSTVYLAKHKDREERVAIKLIEPSSASVLASFYREADLLFMLNHPNIITIKDMGSYENKPYLITEYLQGRDMREIIRQKSIPVNYLIAIIYYVLDALEYAAKFKVIHRDIKPANIFFLKSGEVKLIDFGIGKIMGETYSFSKTGMIKGSPYYMAPEQFVNSKRVDYQADVYAVGATMYHALCGIPPFDSCKSIDQLIFEKSTRECSSVLEIDPSISVEVANIIQKAMSKELENRYSNASEMKKDIMELKEWKDSK